MCRGVKRLKDKERSEGDGRREEGQRGRTDGWTEDQMAACDSAPALEPLRRQLIGDTRMPVLKDDSG